jgi:hypothetical protein
MAFFRRNGLLYVSICYQELELLSLLYRIYILGFISYTSFLPFKALIH